MSLLISNDDGFDAQGIQILVEHLSSIEKLEIYAPDVNKSASGHALSVRRDIKIKQQSNGFYAVSGTPADCVHLAVYGKQVQAERVISGINHGANLGDDILYSGTVAAAFEGRHLPKPAIAVSLCGSDQYGFETAAQVLLDLLPQLDALSFLQGIVFNINIPNVKYDQLKGVQVTRLGRRAIGDQPVKVSSEGEDEYWRIASSGKGIDAGEGTDFYAVNQGFASLTPLFFDKTHYELLPYLKNNLVFK